MATEITSYKSILRGMSIFGGVQVVQILINLVRGKFVAIFLGPAGSGVSSLFASASSSIQQLASLGLPMALTREVSQSGDDVARREATIRAGRRAVMLTALLGLLICAGGSWWLSATTFGHHGYTWQFVLLAVAVAFTLLWQGDQAVLQGLRQVKLLSRATLVSAVVGLAVGVPLYWLYGVGGIVPAMVVLAVAVWAFYQYALRRAGGVPSRRGEVDWSIVGRMVAFGLTLMAGQLIGAIVIYLANIYIRATGSIDDLGNFQAATSICSQYVSLIFAAMAMDYFPRLTASIGDEAGWKRIVNRQTELVVLLSAPLTILLMATSPIVVKLLLTDSYRPAIVLIHFMGAAIFLQSVSYPMGYITFAKGNRRLYFWLEGIFANAVYLATTCVGYYRWGLTGLGLAAIARYAIDVAVYYAVNRRVYGFGYDRRCLKVVAENALYVAAAFGVTQTTELLTTLVVGSVLAVGVGLRSYRLIVKRLNADRQ